MERRLFDDLVVSRAAARKGRGAMPVSFAIHAVAVTAVLVLTALVPDEMPAPPMPPLILEPPAVVVRAPAGGPPRARTASAPGRARITRAAMVLRTEAPIVETEPDVLDPDPVDSCLECVPGDLDDPGGPGGPGFGPVGDPLGAGPGGGEVGPARVRVGGQIQTPRKLRHVDPTYPELARRAGVSAVVILECIIDREGRITKVTVLRGHPLLDAAAVDAVRQWAYRPTLLNGAPVEVVMTVTVNFKATR
jgi:periplasmic protein TonB